MSSYVSKWTGKQIDDSIGSIEGKGLGDVVGIIQRDAAGNYFAAQSYPAAESGTTISIVTTGEKYRWGNMIPLSQKGVANGVVPLNSSRMIDSTYLPGYVDDVLEFNSIDDFPSQGESGKIYVTLNTNLTYRWSGSDYVEISKSLALGETSSTAYYGDKGKAAYDHSQLKGNGYSTGFYKVGSNSEGHLNDAVAVTWADLSGLGAIKNGHNEQSVVTIVPTTTSTYSITSVGSANSPTRLDLTKFSSGNLDFIQDENDETHFELTFTAPSLQEGFYSEGTAAVMPTRELIGNLWNGYVQENTVAAAQNFVKEQ